MPEREAYYGTIAGAAVVPRTDDDWSHMWVHRRNDRLIIRGRQMWVIYVAYGRRSRNIAQGPCLSEYNRATRKLRRIVYSSQWRKRN